jgi:hypothetical protein
VISNRKLRIVQWTAGNVAHQSVRAILERPDMELVGLYTWSEEKIGQDVGDLVDLGYETGIKATGRMEDIIALEPDCVVYNPLMYNVDHMESLLKAGINIVTTTNNFVTDRACTAEDRQRLETAARSGKSSLFGSGMHPGWNDGMLVSATGICSRVNLVRAIESVNLCPLAGDSNQDHLGWGRPAGDPGHKEDLIAGMKIFEDAVGTIALDFDYELDDIRVDVEFAHATEDLEVPGRDVKKGTVAGIMITWQGISDDTVVIELISQWVLSSEITPPWKVEMAYLYEIYGTPDLKIRVDIIPGSDAEGAEGLVSTGMTITALPTVNAIPGVISARPGIITFKDLPPVASLISPDKERSAKAEYRPKTADGEHFPGKSPISTELNSGGLNNKIAAFLEGIARGFRGEKISSGGSGASVDFEGRWNLTINTPGNPVKTELIVEKTDGGYGGLQSGEGNDEPISNVEIEGSQVSWSSRISKPLKLKVDFKGAVEGDRISGKVKAGFFGSFPFSGNRG